VARRLRQAWTKVLPDPRRGLRVHDLGAIDDYFLAPPSFDEILPMMIIGLSSAHIALPNL